MASETPTDENRSHGDGGQEVSAEAAAHKRIRSALHDVRREGQKAALVYAVVDAMALFLAVNVALAVLSPSGLPAQVPVPAAVTDPVGEAIGRSITPVTLPGPAVLAAIVGLLAFAGEYLYRVRKPLVEQFEAANPALAEALRTARDASDDGAETRMAARLYEDVIDRLGESSGVALVDLRRVLGTVVVVVLLSLATVQVAVVDLDLLDGNRTPTAGGSPDDRPREYTGLEDGDAVLGEREDVQAGDENLTAQIDSTEGREEIDGSQQFPSPESSGESGSRGSVESQQAGFAGPEEIEDAELIREYNLRIREGDSSEADS